MIKYTIAALAVASLVGCNNSSSVSLTDDASSDTADTIWSESSDQVLQNCAQTTTVGNAFVRASGNQSDPLFTPTAATDGCIDTASSWAGNQGEQLLLDAGTVQDIQGIYLWMSYDHAEWLSIEQSVDGETWQQSWRRVQSLASAESTYFSLLPDSPTRYVRVTGYGSDDNAWTSIAEARWSLSGENVTSDRVWQHSKNLIALHSGDERSVSPVYQRPLSRMFISCPYIGNPVYVDATGARDSFWQFQEVGGVMVYSFDWDHYPRSAEPDFYAAPLITYAPMRHAQAMLEPLAAQDPLLVVASDCASTETQDSLNIVDDMLKQSDDGFLLPDGWR
mgnify:CR=1 FL=1